MKNKILKVISLTKSYPVYSDILHIEVERKTILKNLSFELEELSVLGILGPSGIGKTTLVKIISNIEDFDSGEILLDGKNLKEYSDKEFATKVQLLFQNPYSMLNPKLTVGFLLKERIKQYFKLNNIKYNTEQIYSKINELLTITKLPNEVLKMYPYELSGGQRQRVS
ncbi:MAG: ATP-binding cassette domain-containing protein, partial [Endomicrobia bacterium]|nr:ATP-binding cassette domain-containing protein [Endomicrobiia bacterium]